MYSINLNLSCAIIFFFIGTIGLISPILFMSNLISGVLIGCAAGIGPYIASAMLFLEWRNERKKIQTK